MFLVILVCLVIYFYVKAVPASSSKSLCSLLQSHVKMISCSNLMLMCLSFVTRCIRIKYDQIFLTKTYNTKCTWQIKGAVEAIIINTLKLKSLCHNFSYTFRSKQDKDTRNFVS